MTTELEARVTELEEVINVSGVLLSIVLTEFEEDEMGHRLIESALKRIRAAKTSTSAQNNKG